MSFSGNQVFNQNQSSKMDSAKLVKEDSKRAKLFLKSLKPSRSDSNENLVNQQSSLPLIAVKATLSPRKPTVSTSNSARIASNSNNNVAASNEFFSSTEGSLKGGIASSQEMQDPLKRFLFPEISQRTTPPTNEVSEKLFPNESASTKEKKTKKKSSGTSVPSRSYRYKIYPGNNSRCLLQSMKKRPWWHAILAKTEGEVQDDDSSVENNGDDLLQHQPSFVWEMYRNSTRYKNPAAYKHILLNHIQRNAHLVTKKGLYLSIRNYCREQSIDMLSIIPLTFYLAPGEHKPNSMKDDDMPDFLAFCEKYAAENNVTVNEINWIMKPASKTNRGFGIKVVKGMNKVLNVVQRGLSACSVEENNNNAATGPACSSLENSFSLDDEGSLKGDGTEEAPAPAEKAKEKAPAPLTKQSSLTKMTASKKVSKPAASNTNSSTNTADAQENNPLTKAAKKIAQQDGYIVQLYLNTPLLVKNRKFDIRCFVLAIVSPAPTGSNNSTPGEKQLKAYFFQDAYIRTSSKKYNLANLYDREIHLTNDAVQKHSASYGKYESGNKLSLQDWQEIINEDVAKGEGNATSLPPGVSSTENIVAGYIFPEIRRLCQLSIAAVANSFTNTEIPKSFELFGYDYMILQNYQPVLIEVNTNPCLEFVNPLLTNIISTVIEHTIRMTVDKEFPPPPKSVRTKATEDAIQAIEAEPLKFEPLYP